MSCIQRAAWSGSGEGGDMNGLLLVNKREREEVSELFEQVKGVLRALCRRLMRKSRSALYSRSPN